MAGFSTSEDSPVTPFRRTHVVFDSPQQVLSQQAVAYERAYSQMARSETSQKYQVVQKPGIGWRVASYGDISSYMDERTEGQSSFLTVGGGLLVVASGVSEAPRTRKILDAEVPGIDDGSSPSLAPTAHPYYRRLWADGDDVSTLNLSTSDFNQPDTTDPSYVMDRIAESVNQYQAGQDFSFEIDVPGTRTPSPDAIASFYFPGPSSETRLKSKSILAGQMATYQTGRGEYCLKLYGTGQATIFERITTGDPYEWVARTTFQYSTPGCVYGAHHSILITQSKVQGFDGGNGGSITFRMANWSNQPKTGMMQAQLAAAIAIVSNDPNVNQSYVYRVPVASGNPIASNNCQVRVDIRRDLRGVEFSVAVPKFFESGTLTCDKFKLGGLSIKQTGSSHPYLMEWFADIPDAGMGGTGASVDLKLYSSITNAELPGVSVLASNIKSYPVPDTFTDTFYIVATLTSATSRALSPTLQSYKVQRDAFLYDTATEAVDFRTPSDGGERAITRVIDGINITGAEKDISHELATVSGADLLGTYDTLKYRSNIPIEIYTEYDPLDATKKLYLFDGYIYPTTDIVPIPGGNDEVNGGAKKVLPAPKAYMFNLNASGKWRRLQENNFTVTQELFQEGTPGSQVAVTTLAKALLERCGFDSDEYDIPDNPIQLYGKGGDPFFGQTPIANLLDAVQRLLWDYLGWFLVWDRNVGTKGKWRALPQVRAPYTNVAAFVTTGPNQSDGNTRVVHNVNSYPLAKDLGDGMTYTDDAPTIFINKGTLKYSVIPPEGNWLYVSTISSGSAPNGLGDLDKVVIVNTVSYDFDPDNPTSDPTNRDYLGRCVPIFFFLPSLTASGDDAGPSLHKIARRIFDFACHALDMRDFEAPIVPITNEGEAGKVRNLRYYDPVTIDGEQFLIRNANPGYTKDVAQMQMIQAQRPNF